ncbi:MAG: alpha/beta fold hydrolase [Myxococcota bacterium]
MATPTDLLDPRTAYRALRDQLGSIRRVYLARPAVPRLEDLEGRSDVVALIHGFFQTPNIWDVMEDRLGHDGFGVVTFHLAGLLGRFNTRRVDECARTVGRALRDLAAEHPDLRIHVVGHSKGGIIARRFVQHQGGDEVVTSLTTLGTPHHGTPLAAIGMAVMGFGTLRSSARELMPGSQMIEALGRDTFPAHIPLTSVYSTSDVVTPARSARLRPRPGEEHHLTNVEVRKVGHSELVWDAGVYRIVREHIEQASEVAEQRAATAEASALALAAPLRPCPIEGVLAAHASRLAAK